MGFLNLIQRRLNNHAGASFLLIALCGCAGVLHALPTAYQQVSLPRYMAINGLSLQTLKSKHLGTDVELNDLNVDKLIRTQKMITARFSVARVRMIFPTAAVNKKRQPSALSTLPIQAPLRQLVLQDLVVKSGVDLSDQLWLGRHRIAANQMDLVYAKPHATTKIHGLSINYALSAKGKRLTCDMDLKMQRLSKDKTDAGPVRMVLSLNRLNHQAVSLLMQKVKPLAQQTTELKSVPHGVNGAMMHLVKQGLRVDLSQFKWVTHEGTLTAQAHLKMPVQKKSQVSTWPDLLRTGVLTADVEVDQRLMQVTVKHMLQKGLMKKMHQAGIKSKVNVSDDEVKAMLALWQKTGLLKVKHQRYLFHCHYEKGQWKINGHLFPVKKTTWWPRQLIYGWFKQMYVRTA